MSDDYRTVHQIGAYRERTPPPSLARLVDVAWLHRAPAQRVDAYPGYLVVPEPAVSLCFACQRDEHGTVEDAELLLIGPVRQSRGYLPSPSRRMEGVRIHPEWSRMILGTDPRDHTDALDDYTAIQPDRGKTLLELLRTTRSSQESLACLLDFVSQQGRRDMPDGTSVLVHNGLRSVRSSRQPARLQQVADGLGVTPRHFRRVVAESSGLSPRDYARHERFRAVVRQADATDKPRWSSLAARHGFADQAHLTREVRRLSGLPPRQLHAERRRDPWSSGARYVDRSGVRIVQDIVAPMADSGPAMVPTARSEPAPKSASEPERKA